MACRLLDQAGRAGCDIVCYPEDIQGIAHYGHYRDDPGLFEGFVEEISGPATGRVSEMAKKYGMCVVFGSYEREGDRLYNAAVLVGRDGKIPGRYRKAHLPFAEARAVTGGDRFPVFEADFGTVGMMVCYDVNFPEVARCRALNGAEMLFFADHGA